MVHGPGIPGHATCAQKVPGATDTHGPLMPVFLEKHLSSVAFRAFCASYTSFSHEGRRAPVSHVEKGRGRQKHASLPAGCRHPQTSQPLPVCLSTPHCSTGNSRSNQSLRTTSPGGRAGRLRSPQGGARGPGPACRACRHGVPRSPPAILWLRQAYTRIPAPSPERSERWEFLSLAVHTVGGRTRQTHNPFTP